MLSDIEKISMYLQFQKSLEGFSLEFLMDPIEAIRNLNLETENVPQVCFVKPHDLEGEHMEMDLENFESNTKVVQINSTNLIAKNFSCEYSLIYLRVEINEQIIKKVKDIYKGKLNKIVEKIFENTIKDEIKTLKEVYKSVINENYFNENSLVVISMPLGDSRMRVFSSCSCCFCFDWYGVPSAVFIQVI